MQAINVVAPNFPSNCGNKNVKPSLSLLALGVALASLNTPVLAARSYNLTDLNTVAAGVGITPKVISSTGLVLGVGTTPVSINLSATYLPAIYNPIDDSLSDISSLPNGDTFLNAVAINAGGQVVGNIAAGYTGTANVPVVVRNTDGTTSDLGVVVDAYSTTPTAININGEVTGYSLMAANRCTTAFLSSVSGVGLQPLGSLEGLIGSSKAFDINNNGQVVGISSSNALTVGCSSFATSYHAMVSTPTGLKDLHGSAMPELLGTGSYAYAINDNGQVAGAYAVELGLPSRGTPFGKPILHAVVWDTAMGTYTDLSTGLNTQGALRDINASGEVVGFEATHAVVGNINDGMGLIDLNTLVANMPVDWTLIKAFSISDTGVILATAREATGVLHNVLLTPVTNPMAVLSVPVNAIPNNAVVNPVVINATNPDLDDPTQ